MSPHRYRQVAAIVCVQVADGTLPPGAPAPSGAALSRMTGYSVHTCRRALRALVMDGVLVSGASSAARPRVPGSSDQAPADASAPCPRHSPGTAARRASPRCNSLN
jgi:GntR family transcriptional regulator/MocR family aminotransferase